MSKPEKQRIDVELNGKTDHEIFDAEVLRLHAEDWSVALNLSVVRVVQLISALHLVARHPAARSSPAIQSALETATLLQDHVGFESPELARILNQGWDPAFDVNHEDGDIDAIEFDDLADDLLFAPNEETPEKEETL